MIKHLEFKCDGAEINGFRSSSFCGVSIDAFNVDEEEIIDALNFEDVMNHFGLDKVAQWVKENRE